MDREIPKKERQLKVIKRSAKILGGIAIGIAVLLFLKNTFQKQISINDIVLSEVTTGTIETSMTASGTVVPAFEEIITTPIPSRIVETYLKVGDSVMAGTPILKLDLHSSESDYEKLQDEFKIKHFKLNQMKINNQTYLSDLAMQIKVSSMKLNRMRAELKNELYLDSLGAGTTDKVRQAELSVSVSQLELEQMRQKLTNETEVRAADEKVQDLELSILQKNVEQMKRKLEDARICAPRAAILTYLNTQVGAQVGQGERIAVISDLAHFKIEGEIADTYADRLRIGGKAKVRVGKDKIDGVISNVAPLSKNGVILFELQINEDGHSKLRSGLKTDVYILSAIRDDVVRISNSSYYKGAGEYELFVKTNDGQLERRIIRLGDSNYEYVEVLNGLQPGEQVVISDMQDFKDRSFVKLKN